METFTQFCAVLAMVFVIQVSEQQELTSPCPEVFTYDQERSTWIGTVELPSTSIENDLNLEVVLSLKRPLPSAFQGFITLKEELLTVFQSIINGRKITYIVNFPLKVEIPSLVSITFNGKKYCDGIKPNKFATIIQLEHKSQLRSVGKVITTSPGTVSAQPLPAKSRTKKPRTTEGPSRRPETSSAPYQELDDICSRI